MICVLALDGLEYNVAVGGRHKNLLQSCYSKLEVPISAAEGVPSSPTVWGSFLTGRRIDLSFKLGRIHSLLRIGKRLLPFISLGLHKKIIKPAEFPELKEKTLLDTVPQSIALNFPFINYNSTILTKLVSYYKGRISLDEAIDVSRETFSIEIASLLGAIEVALKDKPRLLMAYIHFPDIVHHLAYMREDVMKTHYAALDCFAAEVKKRLDKDATFFVVSDHGFDFSKGEHSMYGFLSCNDKTDLPSSIIELHHKIRSLIGSNA